MKDRRRQALRELIAVVVICTLAIVAVLRNADRIDGKPVDTPKPVKAKKVMV